MLKMKKKSLFSVLNLYYSYNVMKIYILHIFGKHFITTTILSLNVNQLNLSAFKMSDFEEH